jgi:hypothetical protein
LRRERSAEEYRQVLSRVAAGVSELVAISGDLTLLGDAGGRSGDRSTSARLDAIFMLIDNRYAGSGDVRLEVADAGSMRVAGDDQRLARAITLVIEHAIRHRRGNACVSVRAVAVSEGAIRIVVDAPPSGFWPQAWNSLDVDAAAAATPLRLRIARRILDDSGGALQLARTSGTDVVHIQLRGRQI